ncbi:MAG: hypothetical protein MZV63_01870 [Marinilabiliales bacterium]|nr:hypothetical protein [Marinilabiliales bacterium]
MRKIFYFAIAMAAGVLTSCGNEHHDPGGEACRPSREATVTRDRQLIHCFTEAYEINIFQPLDHNNPDGPGFTQQVFLGYAGADRPVVVVTEGYSAR